MRRRRGARKLRPGVAERVLGVVVAFGLAASVRGSTLRLLSPSGAEPLAVPAHPYLEPISARAGGARERGARLPAVLRGRAIAPGASEWACAPGCGLVFTGGGVGALVLQDVDALPRCGCGLALGELARALARAGARALIVTSTSEAARGTAVAGARVFEWSSRADVAARWPLVVLEAIDAAAAPALRALAREPAVAVLEREPEPSAGADGSNPWLRAWREYGRPLACALLLLALYCLEQCIVRLVGFARLDGGLRATLPQVLVGLQAGLALVCLAWLADPELDPRGWYPAWLRRGMRTVGLPLADASLLLLLHYARGVAAHHGVLSVALPINVRAAVAVGGVFLGASDALLRWLEWRRAGLRGGQELMLLRTFATCAPRIVLAAAGLTTCARAARRLRERERASGHDDVFAWRLVRTASAASALTLLTAVLGGALVAGADGGTPASSLSLHAAHAAAQLALILLKVRTFWPGSQRTPVGPIEGAAMWLRALTAACIWRARPAPRVAPNEPGGSGSMGGRAHSGGGSGSAAQRFGSRESSSSEVGAGAEPLSPRAAACACADAGAAADGGGGGGGTFVDPFEVLALERPNAARRLMPALEPPPAARKAGSRCSPDVKPAAGASSILKRLRLPGSGGGGGGGSGTPSGPPSPVRPWTARGAARADDDADSARSARSRWPQPHADGAGARLGRRGSVGDACSQQHGRRAVLKPRPPPGSPPEETGAAARLRAGPRCQRAPPPPPSPAGRSRAPSEPPGGGGGSAGARTAEHTPPSAERPPDESGDLPHTPAGAPPASTACAERTGSQRLAQRLLASGPSGGAGSARRGGGSPRSALSSPRGARTPLGARASPAVGMASGGSGAGRVIPFSPLHQSGARMSPARPLVSPRAPGADGSAARPLLSPRLARALGERSGRAAPAPAWHGADGGGGVELGADGAGAAPVRAFGRSPSPRRVSSRAGSDGARSAGSAHRRQRESDVAAAEAAAAAPRSLTHSRSRSHSHSRSTASERTAANALSTGNGSAPSLGQSVRSTASAHSSRSAGSSARSAVHSGGSCASCALARARRGAPIRPLSRSSASGSTPGAHKPSGRSRSRSAEPLGSSSELGGSAGSAGHEIKPCGGGGSGAGTPPRGAGTPPSAAASFATAASLGVNLSLGRRQLRRVVRQPRDLAAVARQHPLAPRSAQHLELPEGSGRAATPPGAPLSALLRWPVRQPSEGGGSAPASPLREGDAEAEGADVEAGMARGFCCGSAEPSPGETSSSSSEGRGHVQLACPAVAGRHARQSAPAAASPPSPAAPAGLCAEPREQRAAEPEPEPQDPFAPGGSSGASGAGLSHSGSSAAPSAPSAAPSARARSLSCSVGSCAALSSSLPSQPSQPTLSSLPSAPSRGSCRSAASGPSAGARLAELRVPAGAEGGVGACGAGCARSIILPPCARSRRDTAEKQLSNRSSLESRGSDPAVAARASAAAGRVAARARAELPPRPREPPQQSAAPPPPQPPLIPHPPAGPRPAAPRPAPVGVLALAAMARSSSRQDSGRSHHGGESAAGGARSPASSGSGVQHTPRSRVARTSVDGLASAIGAALHGRRRGGAAPRAPSALRRAGSGALDVGGGGCAPGSRPTSAGRAGSPGAPERELFLGVTLSFIHQFVAEHGIGAEALTRDVGALVAQLTARTGRSLVADCLDECRRADVDPRLSGVGVASVFVSHAQALPFANLVDALAQYEAAHPAVAEQHSPDPAGAECGATPHFSPCTPSGRPGGFKGRVAAALGGVGGSACAAPSPPSARRFSPCYPAACGVVGGLGALGGGPEPLRAREHVYWLDVFSIPQSRVVRAVQHIPALVKAVGRVALVVEPWDRPLCLTRVWCLYELLHAFQHRCDVALTMCQRESTAFYRALAQGDARVERAMTTIDARRAEASVPADLATILGAIDSEMGFEPFNTCLRAEMGRCLARVQHALVQAPRVRKLSVLTGGGGDGTPAGASSCAGSGRLALARADSRASVPSTPGISTPGGQGQRPCVLLSPANTTPGVSARPRFDARCAASLNPSPPQRRTPGASPGLGSDERADAAIRLRRSRSGICSGQAAAGDSPGLGLFGRVLRNRPVAARRGRRRVTRSEGDPSAEDEDMAEDGAAADRPDGDAGCADARRAEYLYAGVDSAEEMDGGRDAREGEDASDDNGSAVVVVAAAAPADK